MQVNLSLDEFIRLTKSETVLETLNIYLQTEDYPKEEYLKRLVSYATGFLPFTLPTEPDTKEAANE